ncbi:hypothetical protein [Halohasta salina]|uniref:hypothetical protein n=1 Tax=Halohasta salina TaxID=2961621 RepID=UPI0020A3CBA3|nr:hypothetical protein [Halohasta salina]
MTEATAPGDELDTQLRVDSKSDGFQINVGPTESGSRVHYGLSDQFGGSGPDGSAVIEANGDQHVQFPNALAGDSVRMQHLKTQVIPKSGDVRITVQEAGSDPKIDVSPGPGGEGDPVDIKYYRTQSGTEYILESLTQGIVLDSDVANSPAIFSDDDSAETWLISLGSVTDDGSTESDSGIIGPVQTNSGFEIPFGGPLPALAALLGVGLTAAVYWSGRDGFGTLRRVGSRAGSATRSSIPVIGGVLGRLVSGLLTLLSLGGSGLVQLVQFLRARPTLGTLVSVGLVLASVVSGVVPVPQGTTVAIFAVAVPLVSFVVLRRLDEFSPLVWGATSAIGLIVSLVLLGVEFGGLINEQTSLILAVGGLYIAYQAVQAYREGNITQFVIPGRRGGDGQ